MKSLIQAIVCFALLLLTNSLSHCDAKNQSTTVSGGLVNHGNTCYLNAQLECAYHIPKIRDLILEASDESNVGMLSLQHLFRSMYSASQSGNGNPIVTPSVATSVFCRNLGINVYEQQDSQEFWKLLLPELDHDPLTNLYKGENESYITALDGSGREKKRKEVFLDLSIDVSNFDNLYDSLEDTFLSGEVLSVKDGNGWRPEKGAEKVDALKGSTIDKSGLPSVLQLHLMRFSYDMITGGMSKINDRFVYPKVSL
jgi:ubiquitin C-terminal hydrolase